jgi:dienelactone hydrolase
VNDPPNLTMSRLDRYAVALPLVREGAVPENMVVVPRTNVPVVLGGWSTDSRGNHALDIPAFAIARTEVTNAEFKQFVDAGGYDNPAYWQGLGVEDRKRFVDSTNRPGPAGWQLSTYPSGQADLPVGGISWHEAMAYARYRGQELPTIHHWLRAAFAPYDVRFNVAPAVAIRSRFSSEGPASARSELGLGPWGTYHMNGNVREWVLNFAGGKGLVLGGAWPEYANENSGAYTADPMSRLPEYGMRLMQPLAASDIAPEWREPIRLFYESHTPHREPVSDEAFEVMRAQFSSARVRTDDATVSVVRESPLWIAEEIVVEVPGGEPVTVYLVRPRVHSKPLQPIIYAPPQDCCNVKRANLNTLEQLRIAEFIVNSGRALVMPIWWNSYERVQPQPVDPGMVRDREREQALRWQRDLGITLDYLESRADVDAAKVGYLGFSRGASYNSIVLALEPRVKSAVLLSGGISLRDDIHPMLDLVNYAPRIRMPVQMISGRFDHIFPYERSQKRLLELLGTPADQKSHVVFDAGHYAFPPNTVARDASNWFDRHLGPVARN